MCHVGTLEKAVFANLFFILLESALLEAHHAAAPAAAAAGLHSGRLRQLPQRLLCGRECSDGDFLVHPTSMQEILEKD